jgi:hypothetical protein
LQVGHHARQGDVDRAKAEALGENAQHQGDGDPPLR